LRSREWRRPKEEVIKPEPPKPPTVDQIYKAVNPSVVWVYKLDETGRRVVRGSFMRWAALSLRFR
jgi:hypothetical protein